MIQQSMLFDPHHEEPSPAVQQAQLARVEANIAETVQDFLWTRGAGNKFRMAELTEYVAARHPSLAPDSPGRILRLLRAAGRCDYEVVSRAGSEYKIVRLGE